MRFILLRGTGRRASILSALCGLALGGCAAPEPEPGAGAGTGLEQIPERPPPEPAAEVAEAVAARELEEAGDFLAAGKRYLELAARGGADREAHLLSAAEAFLKAGDALGAERVLAKQPAGARRQVLQARLALLKGATPQVYELLPDGRVAAMAAPERAEAHRVLAAARAQDGQDLQAARAWLAAASAAQSEQTRARDYGRLWDTLLQGVAAQRITAADDDDLEDEFRGWVQLALITAKALNRPASLRKPLEQWSAAHAGHPALRYVLPRLRELERLHAAPPERVAVLLPLSGPYAAAGTLVRDGILAAHYLQDQQRTWFPVLRFYDTHGAAPGRLLEQALQQGAEFVLGPLRRENVAALLEEQPAPVPIMVLNHVAEADQVRLREWNRDRLVPKLVQFDLLAEHEARMAAERAWFDGKLNAILIAPETPLGERLAKSFRKHWAELGGHLDLDLRYRAEHPGDLQGLFRLLEPRYAIREPPEPPEGQPAPPAPPPPDAMLFFVGDPAAARQLMPLLHYHELQHLPAYATSMVFSGATDTRLDADLEGLHFPDLPWLLDPDPELEALRTRMRRLEGRNEHEEGRLFAFGMDAYKLVPELARLAIQPAKQYYIGQSGRLFLDRRGHVRRRLPWARFSVGRPLLEDAWRIF